jgi:lycopene cyclase domain-containing protein
VAAVPEYTVSAAVAVAVVVAAEVAWLRTGLFRTRQYWLAMAIVLGFQVPVDGWLTKSSAPIVQYHEPATTGVRAPWDIPVEDFLFGFALCTATIALWRHSGRRAGRRPEATVPTPPPGARGLGDVEPRRERATVR